MKRDADGLSKWVGGFTLIELLIVVMIVGILAAIAIPRFTRTKQETFDAVVRSDMRSMMRAQEAHFLTAQVYMASIITAGGSMDLDGDGNVDFQASRNVTLTVTPHEDGYRITATHTASERIWCVNSSSSATGVIGEIVEAHSC